MTQGLTYAVIRAHALIADILTPERMLELARSGDLEIFIQRLSETPYGVLPLPPSGDPSIALEKAFYSKFIERMTKIVGIVPPKMGEFLQTYYYLRFEVLNLKRILRGKFSGLPVPQIIDFMLPMEPYLAGDYRELAEAETLEKTVEMLRGTPYEAIEASLEFSREYDALWPLEVALNHIYARSILESLKSLSRGDRVLVKRILELEVDVENLLMAIKHRRASGERAAERLEELFPMTFNIELRQIRSLIEAEDLRRAIEGLDPLYSEILSPIYEGDVALIRARLRRHIYSVARTSRSVNDFGFNVIMAYLVFSELEKDDLVGIAWGLTQGIPYEDIEKYLTISGYT